MLFREVTAHLTNYAAHSERHMEVSQAFHVHDTNKKNILVVFVMLEESE